MTSPYIEDSAKSTRTEAEVRATEPDLSNWTKLRIETLPSKDLGAILRSTNPNGKFEREYRWARDELLRRAAPDMLKLLCEVLEWNEDDVDLPANDTAFRLKNFANTCANRSAALRAAISKATGTTEETT
jgi:hypothetical protein